MSVRASRTKIRDPRKIPKRVKQPSASAVVSTKDNRSTNYQLQQQQQQESQHEVDRPRMSFEPSAENQQSLGIGSYMLAGVGVAMGVTAVSVLFGAILG